MPTRIYFLGPETLRRQVEVHFYSIVPLSECSTRESSDMSDPMQGVEANDKRVNVSGVVRQENAFDVGRDMIEDIKEEILNGIEAKLPPLLSPLRDAIQDLRAATLGQSNDPSTQLPPTDENKEDGRLQDEVAALSVQSHTLQDINDGLEKATQQLKLELLQKERELGQRDRKIREMELKNKKLHSIILDTGSKEVELDDEEISKAFGNLDHRILQLVKKSYCNHAAKPSKHEQIYPSLSAENKDLFVRALIADILWNRLFAPGYLPWGFREKKDAYFANLESDFLKSGKIPEEDVIEWRVRTASIAQLLDSEEENPRMYSENLAAEIRQKLTAYATFGGRDGASRRNAREAGTALIEICKEAYRLAALFCRTKTEYTWQQRPTSNDLHAFKGDEYEIVGSHGEKGKPGPKILHDATQVRTVFGGVLKGSGDSKRIKDESVRLTKSYYLLF